MPCTNCFSGCVSTISDKCVKYTGNSIEFLNIHTGDTLESVEKSVTDYLVTVFNGEGIFPLISAEIICTSVSKYLPCSECGAPTLVDILTAIVRAICDIEAEVIAQEGRIDVIEGTYAVGCLTVSPTAGTHVILESAITALCKAIGDITTLENLYATCITVSTIETYIKNYLNTTSTTNLMYTKMVPYVIYPFYPSTTIMSGAFSSTGAGIGIWDKVYLCNGYGGKTPDLRGRSLIGATDSAMGGGTFDPEVDPGSGNPAYGLGTKNGQNSVILSGTQTGIHTHTATAIVTDNGHKTTSLISVSEDRWRSDGGNAETAKPIIQINGTPVSNGAAAQSQYTATTNNMDKTGITVGVSNAVNDGGQPHDNVHPVLACYYIMYLP